ncbi:S-2-hydroxy-acid oxidase [Leptodontidium sp. MPI-SDFR-AT-0119]|nr:S-2-hydroxy-acid oxidase [Leptodontidium sp. MPI-SDFR-AT-0119]
MRNIPLIVPFATAAFGARLFLNEPDTGIDNALVIPQNGSLPDLSRLLGLPDFDWAARHILNDSTYTQFRYGSGGEWSYRNNLEAFHRLRFRPRVMVNIIDIESSLETSILGFNFSAPFFISPCAMAGLTHPEAERGLVEAAGKEGILYMPSLAATLSISEIANARVTEDQVLFQQIYVSKNQTENRLLFQQVEQTGAKAMVLTVDSAGDRTRQRALRYVPDTNIARSTRYTYMTWDYYRQLQNMTSIPIIPKGIQTVEDARMAVEVGARAIFLSNHGGRALDGSPSPVEAALEIFEKDPEIFQQIEVYADGGVRYGTDALKLLALGVRAVGLGRPFMFANVYGTQGVTRAIQLLKKEIAISAASLGVGNLKNINSTYIQLAPNGWYS